MFKGTGFYITDYGKDGKKSQTPPVKAGDGALEKSPADATAAKPPESSPAADGSSTTGAAKSAGESKPASESKPAAPAPAKKSKKGE